MNLLNEVTNYFLGEKIEALVFILPIGLLSGVFAIWLLVEGGSFCKGVAVPFLIMGIVMTIVGGVVGYRTPSQLNSIHAGLKSDANQTIMEEKVRMNKVNLAWKYYLYIWATFGLVGMAFRFLTKSDFIQGLGIALIFFSGVALLIDGFAERRAVEYFKVLESVSDS